MYELKIITMHFHELRIVAVEETLVGIQHTFRVFTTGADLESTGRAAIFHDGVIIPEMIYTRAGFQSKLGDAF